MQKPTVRSSQAIRAGLDAGLIQAYRLARTSDALARALTTATSALREARFALKPSEFVWTEGNGRGGVLYSFEYTRAGLRYVAEIIRDDDFTQDTETYGKFSERRPMSYFGYGEAENFIGSRRSRRDYVRCARRHRREVSAMYDVPADRPTPDSFPTFYRDFHNGGRVAVWYTPDVSEKEQREAYADCGKALAAELAHLTVRGDRSAFKVLRDIYESSIEFVGVRVRCYVGVTELGEAAVWGVDFDGSDFSHVDDLAAEEEGQARHEAFKMLPGVVQSLERELYMLRAVQSGSFPTDADAPRVAVEKERAA